MAHSEAPQDPRPYVRISTDLPLNPKLAELDDPAAGWVYVVSICYAGGSFTDGFFPVSVVVRLAGVAMANAMALAEVGLWHLPGHGCGKCPQPKPGSAYIHDYLQHQRSATEAKDLTAKRREAGRKGAAQRWSKPEGADHAGSQRHSKSNGKPIANAMANAEQTLWQVDGKSMAEERRGEEIAKEPMSASGDEPDGFDAFWDAAPRKEGKAPARIAYGKAIKKPGVTPALLLERVTAYGKRMAKEGRAREKIKMMQGWLNEERWNDETAIVEAGSERPTAWWLQ